MIDILTVEGDLINRCEVFDEADLDAALARFDELHPQARRLENAASQVEQRFLTYFAARDWDAMAEILADDVSMDDRRHVVNAGVRHGRDAEIASQRAAADVGVTNYYVRPSSRPVGSASPSVVTFLGRVTSWSEAFRTSAMRRRDQRRQPDRGTRRVRLRRRRRRLRGARRPIPRWRSGRPRAHVVGHRCGPTPRSTGANSSRRQRTSVDIDHRSLAAIGAG